MEPLVKIETVNCNKCYACVRICPVKAIQVDASDGYPFVNPDRCIGCGSCIMSCSQGVIVYRSSLEEAKALLDSGEKVLALLSPSISVEFEDVTDYRKFATMLRALGIKYACELSFGVDVIAYKYQLLFSDFKGRYYITSTDPVVVSYVEKYHPSLIGNLAPLLSPMTAGARIARHHYGTELKVMYIGPDISKKDEAMLFDDDRKVDVAITFTELRSLFKHFNIDEANLEFSDFDPPLSYKGALYPLTNGMIQAADMDENLVTTNIVSIEGTDSMKEALLEFEHNIKSIHRHVHVTSGNSLSGPGFSKKSSRLFSERLVIKYANKRLQRFFRIEWYQLLQKYLELDYSRTFTGNDQRLPVPPEERITEILNMLEKSGSDSMNCSACGYASCREFAIDVGRGLTIPEMCISYATKNSMSNMESIRQLNEKLTQTRRLLKETEGNARLQKEAAGQMSELTDAMLEKLRAGVVFIDNKLKIIKANATFSTIIGEEAEEIDAVIPGLVGADLNKLIPQNFINLFSYVLNDNENIESRDINVGENLLNVSIFPIVKGKVVGGIIRDMRAPEVQRTEVINRINDVIDRNLEMVQKIGFLLGEGATDIERMLNSIIEFYKGEKKK
ncbi:MAG: 4Fe-4S binding protein [Bacteroidales bacterium]|nr:4Fe-4S binding protein [Bacteroidales bacterium]MBN2762861.1 4Fe-4S binding protein [Bacteroidales bacterium]